MINALHPDNIVDFDELTRQMDITKTKVFLGSNAAFMAPLMCSMSFVWTNDIKTAATNGETLWWNPKWFMSLLPKVRATILVHELEHIARLHMLRCGSRDPEVFNYACDIKINNDLDRRVNPKNASEKLYSFEGTEPWLDHKYDDWVEEDIYDDLMKNTKNIPSGVWGSDDKGDMIEITPKNLQANIANVVLATKQAELAGDPGSIPGDIKALVNKYLSSKVSWNTLLQNFFIDLERDELSWQRPNRRYTDIYMPSSRMDECRLAHLNYYFDVSGSVTMNQIEQVNSEVKYIKEKYNPQKLKIIQFDTRIQKEDLIEENDEFESLSVLGRGGTSLHEVREHLLKELPTAAIIFSDMDCPPMQPLPVNIPIIWIVVGNMKGRHIPSFGTVIYMEDV